MVSCLYNLRGHCPIYPCEYIASRKLFRVDSSRHYRGLNPRWNKFPGNRLVPSKPREDLEIPIVSAGGLIDEQAVIHDDVFVDC